MATATDLIPASGLVLDNPISQNDPPLFCLFTQDWITMQTFIVQALQLPISIGDFETKYGKFEDEADIEGCVAAMKNVRNLSADFGDPTALVTVLANDPTILQSKTAPAQLYLHIVWFATQLYQAATTFKQTLGQFMEILNATPVSERQQVITEILTGEGGLQSTAVSMAALANDLNKALAQFSLKITPATDTMAQYSGNATKFYNDVLADIKVDMKNVDTYQGEADAAYKLWRDLTISAVTVSIGLMIISFGLAWPLAAVAGGVLGSQAKKARDAYDKALEDVHNAETDEQKKIRLKMDLNAFNLQMAPVNVAAQNFTDALAKVEGVWLTIGDNIAYIAKNFTPDQFKDLPVFKDAMKLDAATQDWKIIADKADEYTMNSLVKYHIVPFKSSLPADPTS